jgi:hypothetical protein
MDLYDFSVSLPSVPGEASTNEAITTKDEPS